MNVQEQVTEIYDHGILDSELLSMPKIDPLEKPVARISSTLRRKLEMDLNNSVGPLDKFVDTISDSDNVLLGDASDSIKDYSIKLPRPKPVKSRVLFSQKTQSWIGHVTHIGKSKFQAELHSKNDDTTYEVAEFDIDDVTPSDIKFLEKGAVFYWSIGYFNHNRTVEKKTVLRFRRIVPLKVKEVDKVQDRVQRLLDGIKWT